jgi:16S rRNA (adenine1518-N6/adenine1519-N6)-dimethyltransferase
VTQAAFGQRRKMLRQSLKTLGVEPLALLEAAGIEPTRRAEEVEIEGFAALARALAQMEAQTARNPAQQMKMCSKIEREEPGEA